MKFIFDRNLGKNFNIIFNSIGNRFNIKLFNVHKELISNSLFYNQSKNVETIHSHNENNLEKNIYLILLLYKSSILQDTSIIKILLLEQLYIS